MPGVVSCPLFTCLSPCLVGVCTCTHIWLLRSTENFDFVRNDAVISAASTISENLRIASHERVHLTAIFAAPGVGKTTFMDHFAESVDTGEYPLFGQHNCYTLSMTFNSNMPYEPHLERDDPKRLIGLRLLYSAFAEVRNQSFYNFV